MASRFRSGRLVRLAERSSGHGGIRRERRFWSFRSRSCSAGDGRWLVTPIEQEIITVWEVAKWRKVYILPAGKFDRKARPIPLSPRLAAWAFSPDSKALVFASGPFQSIEARPLV